MTSMTMAEAAERHLRSTISTLGTVDPRVVVSIGDRLARVAGSGGTVFTMGNGGSAATAGHAAADWTAARRDLSPRLRVLALSDCTPVTTALSNDHGYGQVFARQLEVLLRPGDLVVAFSTSGMSENCVAALKVARDAGAGTVGILGAGGGDMAPLCDEVLVVASPDPRTVEDCHLAIAHALADAVAQQPSFGGSGVAGVDVDHDIDAVGEHVEHGRAGA
jgi:D-sedoheptulose 7-phosphate isomerase